MKSKKINVYSILAAIGIAAVIVFLVYSVISVINKSHSEFNEFSESLNTLKQNINDIKGYDDEYELNDKGFEVLQNYVLQNVKYSEYNADLNQEEKDQLLTLSAETCKVFLDKVYECSLAEWEQEQTKMKKNSEQDVNDKSQQNKPEPVTLEMIKAELENELKNPECVADYFDYINKLYLMFKHGRNWQEEHTDL